jgi:exodeoxyribonuclease V gamma subunit
MIRLVQAHRLDALADALAENLAAGVRNGSRSPLEPVDIVVPSSTWASWLKIAIASRAGIAANLRFETLQGFLGEAAGVRIAGAELFESALISILLDPDKLDAADLRPLFAYVEAAGEDADLRDLRRVQLAHQIGRLFEDYQLTRRDIVRAFEGSPSLFEAADLPGVRAITAWQRALWRMIFGPGAPFDPRASSSADRTLSLIAAFEAQPLGALRLPKALHVFGASRLLPAHLAILTRISERTALHLYAPNPCQELWGEDPEGDSPALELWGRAGREGVRIVHELAGYDFEARFEERTPPEPSLLSRFRSDVLRGVPRTRPRVEEVEFASDPSLRFSACPGVRREVEVIADAIWKLVREDEVLRFNEIAVVLAGRDEGIYRAHIGAVFAENFDLPHHMLEVPLASTSRIVEAIELLFALPFSRFLRRDLLRLLIHPLIAPHVRDTPPDEWARWIDALAIVHGADHGDHEETYIERDLYNWDQGMLRLMLGAFMSGDRSGDDRIFVARGHEYLPHEQALDRLGSIAELVALVRSLIADARRLVREKMPLSDWAELIGVFVTTYLEPTSDQDERDLFRCLSRIRDLGALDVDRAPVSFRIASERLKRALSALTTSHGQPLAEGVVVGPLSALAAIPFKAVFITGLGEGLFPVAEKRTPLDLRNAIRRSSDVSAREREEFMFLERILATEERVHISYVARDARTGDRIEPSPVVLELMEILERDYIGGSIARAGLLTAHPLRRWDGEEIGAAAAARRERTALDLRRHLIAHLESECAVPEGAAIDLGVLMSSVRTETLEALRAPLELVSVPAPPPRAGDGVETIEVPYGALRAFLEDPHEGWKRFVLQLRDGDGEDDPLARESETFSATALSATILLREVLFERLALDLAGSAGPPIDAIYDRRALRLELGGAVPTGVFREAERFKHLRILSSWYGHVTAMFGERRRFLDALRFGKSREHAKVDAFVDPLVLDVTLAEGRPARVELYGRTEPLIDGSCSLLALAKDDPPSAPAVERQALRLFLDGVVLSALGRLEGDTHRALVLFASQKRFIRTYRRFSEADARAYLAGVLSDLLSGPHAYQLPCEAVFAAEGSGAPIELAGADVSAIVERRFGPYFARRVAAGESP